MKSNGLSVLVVAVFLAVCGAVVYFAMGKPPKDADGTSPVASAFIAASAAAGNPLGKVPSGPAVEILVSSSDGKKEWLEDVTSSSPN